MSGTLFQPSFASGELAPGLHGRSDLSKWRAGAKLLRNFFVHPQGGVSNRAGTQYVGAARSASACRLIPFTFNAQQTYALEFTAGFIRIINQGAYLTSGGLPYEVASPYAAGDLFGLRYTQSNDVLTIVHPSHAPRELKRLGTVNWTLTPVSFTTSLAAPASLTATDVTDNVPPGTPTPSLRTFKYAVTAVTRNPPGESALSAPGICMNYDLGYYGAYGTRNNLAWTATAGADYYNVYRFWQGDWGFIGSTTTTAFTDDNVLPDLSEGPTEANDPFEGGLYPSAVGYYQQRLVFGGGGGNVQRLDFSRAGNFTSFATGSPLRPDDAITAVLASRESNAVRHLVALQDLIALTASGAWSVSGGDGGVITPASVLVKPQVYAGASDVPPITANFDLLYVQDKGSSVRGFGYNNVTAGYVGQDLSVLAGHLVTGYQITDWAWCAEPHKVVWSVRSDGVMLGFTYLREQEVYAWHQHATDGKFVSVCSVTEGGEDTLYVAVKRGAAITVERMRVRRIGPQGVDPAEGWFVDCGLQYRGAPVTTVSGLGHLEGREVSILADGNVVPSAVVTGGAVSLPYAASIVTVGLPYTAEGETLPLDIQGEQTVQGRRKRVVGIRLQVENTRGLEAAVMPADPSRPPQWHEFKERRNEAWATPTTLLTGTQKLNAGPEWDTYGSVVFRQTRPLPCTVLGIIPEIEVGA